MLQGKTIEDNLVESCISRGDIVFDVGANEGQWSDLAIKSRPAKIYLFEPIKECFRKLLNKYDGLIKQNKISVTNAALFSSKGEQDFYYYPERPGLSGIYRRNMAEKEYGFKPPEQPFKVPTLTIDGFCKENSVEYINYLKIDVEGAEFDVIKGAGEMLSNHRIGFVEFEYGETYLDSNIKLNEIYSYLEDKGYNIFRAKENSFIKTKPFSCESYVFTIFVALSPDSEFVKRPHKEVLNYKCKNQVVFEYLHKFAIDTFIETGTYRGMGLYNALKQVKKAYSIELNKERYDRVKKMFEQIPDVYIEQGDSAKVLPEIMPKLSDRCLFWLDAHYGDNEEPGAPRTPILDELECVLKYPNEFIVLIDDARLYTGMKGWPSIDTIMSVIQKSHPNCSIEVKDDIIRFVPKTIKPIAEDDFISMSTLGSYGRFGNQLFQYAALRIYANENFLRPEIPVDWLGRKLFIMCNDLPISDKKRQQVMIEGDCIWLNGQVLKGYDIKGYCQWHTSHFAKYKNYIRSLFTFIPPVDKALREPTKPLREATSIGIHIRLSDYRLPSRQANIAPTEWYLKWLEKNWDRIDNPKLFVASDEIEYVVKKFHKYKPDIFAPGANYLYDFYTLAHCDYMLISNSTFSFTAAMLNEKGKEFYRPDFEQEKLVSFDPWNAEPLLKP